MLIMSRSAGALFSADDRVQAAVSLGLFITACGQPIAGLVYVLDGVLIGAGDTTYLAKVGLLNLATYAVVALAGWQLAPAAVGLAVAWASYIGIYMGLRAVTLRIRYRGQAWIIAGRHTIRARQPGLLSPDATHSGQQAAADPSDDHDLPVQHH
jgi:Na+-driven multidrug efflux pump